MKKAFFLLAVLFIFAQSVFGQENVPKVTIQTSPFLALFDAMISGGDETLFIGDLEAQFRLTNKFNISVGLSSLVTKRTYYDDHWDDQGYYIDTTSYQETVFQIRLRPMFIYRPFEKGLEGFYIGFYIPSIGFMYTNNEKTDTLYTEIGTGLNIGYKWVFRNGFTMQLGGGVGKTFSVPERSEENFYMNSDGSINAGFTDLFIWDFKLGYSF